MIIIKTYQDLKKVLESNDDLMFFIMGAISDHKGSDAYRWAQIGEAYDRQENTTIKTYQKLLYTVSGMAIPDNFSANHKLASNYYNRINVQENQYLLGNGATFNDADLKKRLGKGKYSFDTRLQKLGKLALTQGQSFGFWNYDHIDVFEVLEFCPLYDEENGALRAGIRFWQIDESKPLRVTLYEEDGYTEYIKHKEDETLKELKPKRAYILKTRSSKADGTEIYDGENYPGFPIVPLWGNQDHVCKIKAWQCKIDCYDLIESGFANDVDDASLIYWTITNAGGMDDVDLAEFIQRMKTVKAATISDTGAQAEAHTIDVPVNARQTYLLMLDKDIIKDAMALDTDAIANGNTVATAIRAAYEPLNNKTDDYEYCVNEFIQGILELIGVDDEPTFKRSTIINQTEETNMVLAAAQYLDHETVLQKLPFISNDEVEDILAKVEQEQAERLAMMAEAQGMTDENTEEEEG